ncbi:hypothetical protein RFI_34880, partial [Reticulomyxa filosa]
MPAPTDKAKPQINEDTAENKTERKNEEESTREWNDYSSDDMDEMSALMSRMCPLVDDLAELSDSSVESDGPLLRTGNVPKEWYEKEYHQGYDIDGKK